MRLSQLTDIFKKVTRQGLSSISSCMQYGNGQLTLCQVKHPPDQPPELTICESIPCATQEDLKAVLPGIARSFQLKNTRCNWVLHPDDYRLLLIDTPNVNHSELNQAARWAVKDLIDIPLDDAAIDTFPAPETNSVRQMSYVVATRLSFIQSIADLLSSADTTLETIDIQELAYRNLINFTKSYKSAAVLHIDTHRCDLSFYQHESLFLTRQLDANLTQLLATSDSFEKAARHLALEIQRSLDYFEMQYRQTAPSTLLLNVVTPTYMELDKTLPKHLNIKVENLSLTNKLTINPAINHKILHACSAALGGALRNDVEAFDATN